MVSWTVNYKAMSIGVQKIVSSDEELDVLYRRAKRDYQFSGALWDNFPRPHRFPTRPPSSPSDFACDTPEPSESQGFFLRGQSCNTCPKPTYVSVMAPWLTETTAANRGVFRSRFSPSLTSLLVSTCKRDEATRGRGGVVISGCNGTSPHCKRHSPIDMCIWFH